MTDDRFATPKSTLLVDRFMTGFIKVGGLAVIIAVCAIMVFIASQAVPLFGSASVRPLATLHGPVVDPLALAVDEWGGAPAVLGRQGDLAFLPLDGRRPVVQRVADGPVTAVAVDPVRQRLVIGTRDRLAVVRLAWTSDNGVAVDGSAEAGARIDLPGTPVAVAWAETDRQALAGVVVEDQHGARRALLIPCLRKRALGGAGRLVPGEPVDVTGRLDGRPAAVLVDEGAETAVVATAEGHVGWFAPGEDGAIALRQSFRPFDDRADRRIAGLGWIFGDVSISVVGADGANRIFSLHHRDGADGRSFGRTQELAQFPGPAAAHAHSVRNKGYLVAGGRAVSLRHATTADERWRGEEPVAVRAVAFSGKHHRIATLGDDGAVRIHLLDDPHPESGWKALFGRIWYEGAPGPAWTWQSSGANDDFEPKLSMVPLLFGTLKATFYALLFAVPIALLAAVYTAEFMHPRFKAVVKPAVEIMASLPSVVLGFLAALWLAPLIESKVPSILCLLVALPAAAAAIGWGWSRLSPAVRSRVRPGWEFIALIPVLVLVSLAAWSLGPALERAVFTVPVAGPDGQAAHLASFARWWPWATGLAYEQRNSLVVGVMMGFAVIPIIFTIAEDSLSNVPKALRSGSLALGASRWQTAWRVVVPTASAGIFSACMIGLGRAIGETMIVVMATGNTAIMDGNLFNGMRTLSANIAVELPEAPHHSTLYRTLFLGALLLFMLTFVINTAAEILRSRLREKYKTV